MRPRFYLAVALLAIMAGCAFSYSQTIRVGMSLTDKLDSYRCRSAYRNGYTAALDSIRREKR